MKHVDTTNLAEATAQEVFDFILDHLGKMSAFCGEERVGMKAVCFYYRGDERCAAGSLLTPDDIQQLVPGPADSSHKGHYLGSWHAAIQKLGLTEKHARLITVLQRFHDHQRNWNGKTPGLSGFNEAAKAELKRIAHEWSLQVPKEIDNHE